MYCLFGKKKRKVFSDDKTAGTFKAAADRLKYNDALHITFDISNVLLMF